AARLAVPVRPWLPEAAADAKGWDRDTSRTIQKSHRLKRLPPQPWSRCSANSPFRNDASGLPESNAQCRSSTRQPATGRDAQGTPWATVVHPTRQNSGYLRSIGAPKPPPLVRTLPFPVQGSDTECDQLQFRRSTEALSVGTNLGMQSRSVWCTRCSNRHSPP